MQFESAAGIVRRLLKDVRKRLGVLVICLGVVGCAYWVMFHHYSTFRFDKANDTVYKLESKLLDFKLKARGPVQPSGKVGILAIDEKSIARFGRWPFSRKYYEQAFINLKKLGVKWIGFDAIYAEPEPALLADASKIIDDIKQIDGKNFRQLSKSLSAVEQMRQRSPGDTSFQRAIHDFGNIVLGYIFFGAEKEAVLNLGDGARSPLGDKMASSKVQVELPAGRDLKSYPFLKKAYGLIPNTPGYTAVGKHFAFFTNDADDDATHRWLVLLANVNGRLMPSLALKTAAEYMDREIMVFFDSFGTESIALVSRTNQSDAIELPIDPLGSGRMVINHLGPGGTFWHYSLADAYDNKFTDQEKENLKGVVLLLGATATGINDIRPNPFDPTIDGVENHAAIIENILTQNYLRRPVSIYKTELLLILAIGLLFAPIMMWAKALFSGVAVSVFLLAYYYFDRTIWFQHGTWTFMAIPTVEILAIFILTTLYKYMTVEAEKKRVKGAFAHYLSPEVINQMLDDPNALQLGGVKKELTVLFSDMRGFTTIAESLSPEKLCELMNAYFTPMTGIVLKGGGVLDKYIGDAIMAFWGAPIDLPNSSDSAAVCAIEMLYALDQLRDDFVMKGFPLVDIGVGLNTGPMSVGNMGSAERFTYTVMGDSVNLGSRLEGLTKDYGVKIMMSEFTQRKLTPGKFFHRDLDDVRVIGKHESVNVFELMRPDFLPQGQLIHEFCERFNAGRQAYKGQRWNEAKAIFAECLKMKVGDAASHLYLQRIAEYQTTPPDENWDGVYASKHK